MDSDNFQHLFSKSTTYSCSASEIILFFGTVLLLLILLAEFFDLGNVIPQYTPKPHSQASAVVNEVFEYGYNEYNGPSVWKCKYPGALGCRQSPININCKNAMVCPTSSLNWSCEYTVVPDRIRIRNDGHCVTLQAVYPDLPPTLRGGPLNTGFALFAIRFRWGPIDDEGSEHTIDYKRYAMELQAIHLKCGCSCEGESISNICENDSVVVISYMLQITTIDNPYLEPVLAKLERIKYPGFSTAVSSFPICWLMPPFISDYYMYQGSLTYPPCTEGVQWIVQPEPLAVSSRQVRQFRRLVTRNDGYMITNTRPIQCLNNRDIFYYTANDDCKCK